MSFENPEHKGQTKTGPPLLPGPAFINSVKSLKKSAEMLFLNTQSIVGYINSNDL